jgi:hypothetical protein
MNDHGGRDQADEGVELRPADGARTRIARDARVEQLA